LAGADVDPAREIPESPALPPPERHVHVLMVHGVGRHDRLSSLLEIYQAIRSSLLSPEAPAAWEDRIPDWKLELFDEGANPPFLKLRFDYLHEPDDATVVYLYEVNYSTLAGVIRANHRLDLTTLFVGFDLAVCWSRQQQRPGVTVPMFPGEPHTVARSLQRVSGVMAAATGPLLGLPSMLLSRFSSTSIAAFTRFFEDIATYALDKNGEQLISQHLDRICQNIHDADHFKSTAATTTEFVMAGHSLGGVVTHSYLVRHWHDALQPQRVVTFGSPIGVITWLWLFLDFEAFDFRKWRDVDTFFCWSPIRGSAGAIKPFTWINVLNGMDPLASAFPDEVAHLQLTKDAIASDLVGRQIEHRYFGPATLSATGRAHTRYIHDRDGLLEILRRAAGLGPGEPTDVKGQDRAGHWRATYQVVGRAKVLAWLAAMAFIIGYCALIAWHFDSDWWIVAAAALFGIPSLTVGIMAFVQRFVFGVRTKRISRGRIMELTWDPVSAPYRLRRLLSDTIARAMGRKLPSKEEEAENEKVPAPHPWIRRLRKVVAFVPTLLLMSIPVAIGVNRQGWPDDWPATSGLLGGLGLFVLYLISCAAYELMAAWRTALADLGLAPHPPPATGPTPGYP
jgi:hypothetical protein